MSERDELAGIAYGAMFPYSREEPTTWPPSLFLVADAILAAGYRKPRTITTAAELDALPVDAAVIGTSRIPNKWPGAPYAKASNGEWYDYANGYHVESEDVLLPATVTFEPEPQP